jgi:hypothetical protein
MRWTRVQAAWSGNTWIPGQGQGVNRGAAILGDRVYFTTNDNYLTALDRQTGVVIFSRKFADENKGTTSTSAPLVVGDKVIVGSAGGDSGVRGFVAALSAETGDELWRTYFIPAKGEPGAETWGDLIEWGAAAWLSVRLIRVERSTGRRAIPGRFRNHSPTIFLPARSSPG